MVVAVLGASPNPERYSNKAIRSLLKHGHEVIPVHPAHKQIEGLRTVGSLAEIGGSLDTLTVYVGPQHIHGLISEIIHAKPKRVILNPGTESEELETALTKAAIPFVHACTLVMLSIGQF